MSPYGKVRTSLSVGEGETKVVRWIILTGMTTKSTVLFSQYPPT